MEAMTLEQSAYLAEIFGVFAIVVSLVYLALQMRQNNHYLQEQAEFGALQNRVGFAQGFAENGEISRLVYCRFNQQPLTEIDELRRVDLLGSVFVRLQWEFIRESSGLLHQFDSLDHMASAIRSLVQRFNAEDAWHERKLRYRADFVQFMDTQVIGKLETLG